MNQLIPNDQGARDRAIDPTLSCIVQAPAGAGKTTLLANRFISLLEVADRPEEILAITFTIKAAAEMKERVLQLLTKDSPIAQRVRQRAETLGWQLAENPNALKIQTIDSFALELAGRAPGNFNLSGYEIAENPERYYREAAEGLIGRLIEGDVTASLIAEFLAHLDNDADNFVRLVSVMLTKRDQWLGLVNSVSRAQDQKKVGEVLQSTIAALRDIERQHVETLLSKADQAWLSSLADGGDDWSNGIQPLLTKAGTLRKKIPTALVPDKDNRKTSNEWLAELHSKNLGGLLERFAILPTEDGVEFSGDRLQTCCVVLALAAFELDRLFRRDGITDFTGLLLHAKTALRDEDDNPTDLALVLDYRIKHILVDEFQDTSRGQLELFEMLLEPWQQDSGNTFFAVGDPMQSIYRFRDADVQIFHEARTSGIGPVRLQSLDLEANFRSDTILVDWVNQLFGSALSFQEISSSRGNLPERTGSVTYNPATAMQPPDGRARVDCKRFDDVPQEIEGNLVHIESLLDQDNESSIALLCRSRTHLVAILKKMSDKGINWQATDIDLLQNSAIVIDLMSSLSVLLAPHQRLPWFALLRSPLFGASLADLLEFSADDMPDQLAGSTKPYQRRLHNAYVWAESHLYELSIREVLEGFWQRCGGADAYSESDILDAQLFLELIDSISPEQLNLTRVTEEVSRLFAQSRSRSRLNVLTIHKAKGLEFDHVIVPRLEAGTQSDSPSLLLWQPTQAGVLMGLKGDTCHAWLASENRRQAKSEELRLLYVACTRAKKTLHLSFTAQADKRPGGLAAYLNEVAAATEPASAEAVSPASGQPDLFTTGLQHRLPKDYQWLAPAKTELPAHISLHKEEDLISHRFEVEVGNLVHRLLEYCSQTSITKLDDAEVSRLLNLWTNNQDDALLQAVSTQVQKLLDTELGRWVLAPHDQHESESAYQIIEAGEVATIVIDRMFVDDGVRWIIDYKTSQHSVERQQELRERYRGQLQRYATAMQSLYPEPIRAALLFVDAPSLEVVVN